MQTEEGELPGDTSHQEERISLHGFKSSDDLKREIRRIMVIRSQAHFQVHEMFTEGPFIHLIFKQEVSQ